MIRMKLETLPVAFREFYFVISPFHRDLGTFSWDCKCPSSASYLETIVYH